MGTAEENQTVVMEFILIGFRTIPELQGLLLLLFLAIYIATVVGNLLIVAIVVTDQHLHTPMYFFLVHLSCMEMCCTCTILPRMLATFLTNEYVISLNSCFLQYYFLNWMEASECCLLSAMSYDRYLAICKPLHYATRMNGKFCLQLAIGSWINGMAASTIVTAFLFHLIFCGPNEIDHFFCDLTPMMNLSCGDTSTLEIVTFILASIFTLPPFLLTVISYICIIATILGMPSATRRHKAFSTCSSHLIVVTLFYGSLIIVYVLPKNNIFRDLKKVFSFFYTVLTPIVNPLIYSLRNKNVKEAFAKAVSKYLSLMRDQRTHTNY
ncbi:olfactory receptor 10A7-like [Alligator sinensis]|uniref:Olfactory receptor n=1 Tax=Alligator sinensis TaxID=38654 RepID=A0A3Q0FTR3_ALLSI|nr:olfactory receptor 10A7-like [Alligator sinensis]